LVTHENTFSGSLFWGRKGERAKATINNAKKRPKKGEKKG
jgi:hypothetical protein